MIGHSGRLSPSQAEARCFRASAISPRCRARCRQPLPPAASRRRPRGCALRGRSGSASGRIRSSPASSRPCCRTGATGSSAARRTRPSRRSPGFLGGYRFEHYRERRKEARPPAVPPRGVDAEEVSRIAEAVTLGPRPRQHARERPRPGRDRSGGARARGEARRTSREHRRRRPARAELPDDPCRRPRLAPRAAADRPALGR